MNLQRVAAPWLFLLLLLSTPALAQVDSDNDGVDDSVDACVGEDASFFDADGDGCIDAVATLRHREYWATSDLPLEYTIHSGGAPNLGDGSEFTAVEAGFAAWSSVADAAITSVYLGTTAQADADGTDGINLVTWQDPEFLSVYGNAVLAVGITTSFTTATNFNGQDVRPGQIVDSDMIFNPNRTFSTDSGGFGPDLRSVATHEAGHMFGLTHSAVVTSTMFPALPTGTNGRSLELEDQNAAFMAYPLATALANATTLSGVVLEGSNSNPIAGAAVFAISAATGDTLGSQFTDVDGSYLFVGLAPGDYNVAISPLEGAQSNGVVPGLVSDYLQSIATSTLWLPEFWDLAESNNDIASVADPVTLVAGSAVTGIDILTNVDQSAPSIVKVDPATTGVIRDDAVFVAAFDEAIDFNSAQNNVTLEKVEGSVLTQIGFALIQVSDEKVFIVNPGALLDYSSSYRLTLKGGISDRFGNPLGADTAYDFQVEAAPPLNISTASPQFLAGGAVMVLYGQGFDLSTAANNVVSFNGIDRTAITVGPNSLSVSIPGGLADGTVDVAVRTPTQTSNTLTLNTATSVDLLTGSDIITVPMSGDVSAGTLLPDATFAYVGTSAGIDVVSAGATLPDFGNLNSIPLNDAIDAIAVSPDGSRVYGASRDGRRVTVINSDYGDPANPNATFNTVIDELDLDDNPVGLTVDPSGQRLYVAMAGGVIQVWDVELGSGTFHLQVDEIVTPATSLQGAIAVDRTGARLLALSGSGDLLVYLVNDPALPPQQAFIGSDPRDILVDPQGSLAYIVDGGGSVSVFLLSGGVVSQVIQSDGSPRAMAINPGGSLAYLADRANDQLTGIDLGLGNATFRTVVGALPTGAAPTDVDVSPNGLYAMSLEDGADELRLIGVGSGIEAFGLEPDFGRPGDIIMISGSGFAPTPEPGGGIISSSSVFFGNTVVSPIDATFDQLHVRVPDTYNGEPIRVTFEGAAVLGQPSTLFSNPLTFRLLDPQPNAPAEDVSKTVFLGVSNGYTWDDVGVNETIEVSPDGDFVLAVSLSNTITMLDANPLSPDFGQIIATGTLPVNMRVRDLVIAPNGKLAYWSGADNEIHILNTDREDPLLLTEVGTVTNTLVNTFSGPLPGELKITGSGHLLVALDDLNDQVYFVELRPESPSYHQTIIETGPLGFATDLVIHPSGLTAYFTATGRVHVIDLDPNTPSYLTELTSFFPTVFPRALACSPDGNRLLVVGELTEPTFDFGIEEWDVSTPTAPTPRKSAVALTTGITTGAMDIWINPTGDRAIVDAPTGGLTYYLDIRDELPGPAVELTQLNINGTSGLMDLAFNPNGSGFWSASRGDTGITFTDLARSNKLTALSGFTQFGVAGEPLAAPLVFGVDDGAGNLAVGAVAEVTITSGGGSLSNGKSYQWITSDANGHFNIEWTLGPAADVDPANPQNRLSLTMNDGSSLANDIGIVSVVDPNTLPMSQVQVLPLDAALDVSSLTTVQATFSRSVSVSSVDASSLALRKQGETVAVAVAYGFADNDTRVSMTPLQSLESATTYEIVTTAALTDASGGALANPQVTTFTTEAPPALSITSISPPAATVGTPIVISGTGFSSIATDNVVSFSGGASATAVSAGPGYVSVFVPLGAVTGDLAVAVGLDSSPASSFTVLVPETAPLDDIVQTVDTGITVSSVAVLPDGSKAYTVSTESDEVLPVELVNYASLPPISVGDSPTAIVIHPNGQLAYVTNYGSGSVSVIDTATDNVTATINVGTNPVEIVASPVGDRLYVINELDQTLSVIDIDASSATYHTVVASVPTSKSTKGAAITPDGTKLYLGTSDGFLVIDLSPAAFGVALSVPTSKSTKGAAITPDGNLLLLLTATNEVLIVDISEGGNNAVVASVPTSKSTKGAAITPDGTKLYLLLEDTDAIVVVQLNISGSVTATAALGSITVTTEVIKEIAIAPEPAVIAFDPSGSGLTIVAHQSSAGTLTFLNASSEPFGEIIGELEVQPQTVSLATRGRYITAYLSLPNGFFVENIDLSTVLMLGQLSPVPGKSSYVDRDKDGINELSLKFDRCALQQILPVGDWVEVDVTGNVDPGAQFFTALDTIRTLRPVITHPSGGDRFYPGQVIDVTWDSPPGLIVTTVDVHYSVDDGATWIPIALDIADTGIVQWVVPQEFTNTALIEVTLKDDKGEALGIGLTDGTFFILEKSVPVAMQNVDLRASDGVGLISWQVPDLGQVQGFDVLRADTRNGDYQKVNSELIEGVRLGGSGSFTFEDESIFANRDYHYLVVENLPSGDSFTHGPYELNWSLQSELLQNVPNTFNPRTTISFSIAQDGPTRLVVYNLAGRVVDVLVNEDLRANTYKVIWNGTDERGHSVASGVYVYRLVAPGFEAAKRMTLVR